MASESRSLSPQVAATERTQQWLALSITHGLGPTRVRRLIEAFGNVGAIFRASLTELEATGIPAAVAQSIATGKSMELAHEEWTEVVEFGATLMCPDDDDFPARLGDLRSATGAVHSRRGLGSNAAGDCNRGHASSHAVWSRNGRAAGDRPGGTRFGDSQRSGAWCGRCGASRGAHS